jgi:hypothetical protein
LRRPPPDRGHVSLATKRRARAASRTAGALLAAAVTLAGFSLGYVETELAVALDRLMVFCGVL